MMFMTDAEMTRRVLSAIFRTRGGDGRFTRLFENLDQSQRDLLRAVASIRDGELPVIGSIDTPEQWLLITTQRVIWQSDGLIRELPATQIRHVNPGVFSSRWKTQMQTLQIETTSHKTHTISAELGAPLFGVWNVLLNFGARNRAKGGTS